MLRLLYALLIVALLLLIWAAAPSHADGLSDKLSVTLIAAPNDGPVVGAALSYRIHEHLWGDLGCKRDAQRTDPFLGLSTDLALAAGLLDQLFRADLGTPPRGARVGGGYDPVDDSWLFYLGYSLDL